MLKYLLAVLPFVLVCIHCLNLVEEKQKSTDLIIIPRIIVNEKQVSYNNRDAKWYYNDMAFTGYIEEDFSDGSTQKRFGVYHGLKHGSSLHWYKDGRLRMSANYHLGKLHGDKKYWLDNDIHQISSHLQYEEGKLQGRQKLWYDSGEVYKLLYFNLGQEEGLQQAFRKNGAVYANYEAREGRVFGMRRASLCFELENEKLIYGQ